MGLFEITVQRQAVGTWPVVVRYQPSSGELTQWRWGRLALDLNDMVALFHSEKQYGELLGRALFREEIREAFVHAVAAVTSVDESLRVLLIVEADDLRHLHWEQLHAPLDGVWDYLLLNQRTPFSLYTPSRIGRHFPPIGRRDLRALLLVSGREELEGDYGLSYFDIVATVSSVQRALGEIPCDVLASADGAIGSPTLDTLCEQLTAGRHTLFHIVCHGAYQKDIDETVLYFPRGEDRRPVPGTRLIECFRRLDRLPRFAFLSTCESASPQAEAGLGGLGQRLVRELGMPAVVAMTDLVSIINAQALSSAFYAGLREHGKVDQALCKALSGLEGIMPALLSRLSDRPLWNDNLDRELTEDEVSDGLKQVRGLLKERAPVLCAEFEAQAVKVQVTRRTDPHALSAETRRARDAALTALNQLCSEALDLSFNALALGQEPPDYDARCPFPGLSAFGARFLASGEKEQDDREFFVGRDELVKQLMKKLSEHNFLAILGPSGSGKSSLVVAGLIPALQEKEPVLQMVYLTPGNHPLAQLEAIQPEVRGQADILVVDQFEGLFTLCEDEGERRTFLDRLLALADETRVVIAIRANFLGDCTLYPALKLAMQARQQLIAPMEASELRAAMEQQAAVVGLRFEADLSNTILDDVKDEPGAMPLLQHTLLELWKRRHGRWLLAKEYRDEIGGAQQAIARTADTLYNALPEDDRLRMRDIFLRLTRLGQEAIQDSERRDTPQRLRFEELVPAGGDPAPIRELVRRLADERLVVTGPWAPPVEGQALDESQVKVEMAHQALIPHWDRLKGWLDENRAELRLLQGVRQAAQEWQAHKHDEAYLIHRGGRLEHAEALNRHPRITLNGQEQAYLNACLDLRERERQDRENQRRRELEAAHKLAQEQKRRAEEQAAYAFRMRSRALVIGVIGLVAIVLAVLSILFWTQAQTSATTAKANLALAETNVAEASTQEAVAVTNEARANVESTRAVGNAATAEFNAEEAQRQSQISRARELAALALSRRDQHLDLALLLSVETFREEKLLQAREALFEAWRHNPHLSHYLHGHRDRVWSVAWSADGRLASGSADGTVVVWDLSQADMRPRQPVQILRGLGAEVMSVAWSADGRLASGSGDGTVIVWDLERNQPGRILKGHFSRVMSVAWSADGRLASGSEDGTVIVWDLEGGLLAQTLEGHSGPVWSVAWSADGRLASAASDETIIIWDLERDKPDHILKGHSSGVRNVTWSVDGRLASGSEDHTVIIWDLESGLPDQILGGHSGPVNSVTWSADGRLASGSEDRTVAIWDLDRAVPIRILEGHAAQVWSVAWSADGRLATGSEDDTVIIWNPTIDVRAKVLRGQPAWVWSLAWSTEGQLASGLYNDTVVVWDLARGEPTQILKGHSGPVNSVTWSVDGRLASGSGDGKVIIWDLSGTDSRHFALAQILEGHSDAVNSVAWSEDGQLASASSDGTVIVWDLKSGLPAQILEGHSSWVMSVAWSPDGRLASGSYDNTVIVWDLERSLPAQILEGHSEGVLSVAWSVDGRVASASSDETIFVWDPEDGLPTQILEGHSSRVKSAVWSVDGRLASGSEDRTVIIWDLESGLPAHTLAGHGAVPETVAWSADGQWLAIGSEDGTAQLWPMEPRVWIREACERAGRNLTQDEWAIYFPDEEYRKTCDQWPAGE